MPQQPQEISGNSQAGQIERNIVKILQSLREKSDFDNIVSTCDDSNRTLAHLSVQFGYIYLLKYLVEWRIDLKVADVSGLTALHCAYLKGDRESIRILLRAGASPSVKDKLGRLPRDLAPEGLDLEERLMELAKYHDTTAPGLTTGHGHRSDCTQIPKLRFSAYPDADGERTMYTHCEGCGAIEIIKGHNGQPLSVSTSYH